ncbi:fungal-specific transcription factor domain-containing protein [Rostrohypoxylon terebratum]|nr:fungal-specific transcription factor domain-containing protein [Rostrohypoxylon terebratum]
MNWLRRKPRWASRPQGQKCDQLSSVYDNCVLEESTCEYDKPNILNGGARPETKEDPKRRIEEKKHVNVDESSASVSEIQGKSIGTPVCEWVGKLATPPEKPEDNAGDKMVLCSNGSPAEPRRESDSSTASCEPYRREPFDRREIFQVDFYLEDVFPFLFPFYRPRPLQGGRSWILESAMSDQLVRMIITCQASHFFSLLRGTTRDEDQKRVAKIIDFTFEIVTQGLRDFVDMGIKHLRHAIQILVAMLQVQRFEISISIFHNCQQHLDAAMCIFKGILGSTSHGLKKPHSSFVEIMHGLEVETRKEPGWGLPFKSAEQTGFRFSSALLIFDDIISSTTLQEEPRLFQYLPYLLGCESELAGQPKPLINLADIIGCQNFVMLKIADISALNAWKHQCKRAEYTDANTMAQRAAPIYEALEDYLAKLERNQENLISTQNIQQDIFITDPNEQSPALSNQVIFTTRVWAHAAALYLSLITAEWKSTNIETHYHVNRIIDILARDISPPARLRAMAWPIYVAGCLARPEEENSLYGIIESLQPPSLFSTVYKALDIMENVWGTRGERDASSRDLAACFKSLSDELLLLV